jgi:uncharacterized protein
MGYLELCEAAMINRKGIFSFLLITFGVTYLMEGILILSGFRVTLVPAAFGQYTVMAAMWVPALATFLTIRFVTHEKLSSTLLRFGPSWKPYLFTLLAMPFVFLVIYLITWGLGLGQPDWQLKSFFGMIGSAGMDISTAPPPSLLLSALLASSIFIAPLFNSILGFGEEWGWRGFLLPRLMPLGKWKAYLILGVTWGLWHAPLVAIGFNYPGQPVLGILFMCMLTTAIGIFINEMTLRYQSSLLAGWIHGAFNAQGYGIWRTLLFPTVNPLLGGFGGLVGIAVIALFGLGTLAWFRREAPAAQPLQA